MRQQAIARTREEIEALTTEKTRLNLLRDANHRFVENACHDFRSPLTVIKEFAAIIAEGLAGDVNEEQSEFLQIILTRVDHLSAMVDGILDASRLESDLIGVRREEQPVAKLIEQARSTLEQRAVAAKMQIEFAIPDGLPNVFADVESIGRVIVNLGANACKYAGENGKIKVWARYNADERNVTIGVTDNGPGISPEHVKLIFDRFQQLPKDKAEQKDGFGLGLHIASELVRVNFGTLSVESEPHEGQHIRFHAADLRRELAYPAPLQLPADRAAELPESLDRYGDGGRRAPTAQPLPRSSARCTGSFAPTTCCCAYAKGNWLVCAAGDAGDLAKITERILGTYAEISRNRPEGRLPDIRFRPIGSWTLSQPARRD